MKEKLSKLFKMKSFYISVASVALCGAVTAASVIIVHNNNRKLDAALAGLNDTKTAAQNIEDTAVVLNEQGNGNDSKDGQGEDKAIQYLAEYDRITAEYEKNKAELNQFLFVTNIDNDEIPTTAAPLRSKPNKSDRYWGWTDEQYSEYLDQYEKDLAAWEEESRQYDISVSAAESKRAAEEASIQAEYAKNKAKTEKVQKQLDQLELQYKNDIEKLKNQYGVK